MSDDDQATTGHDALSELGKQLPWHRPDAERREAVRSALLVAVSEGEAQRPRRPWALAGAGFAAGALAAAAIVLLVVRPHAPASVAAPQIAYAQIEASSAAELEHTRTPTPTGTDETVRIRTGKIRLAVPSVRTGDRVRVQTADASVEGTGAYEVVVAHDALTSVTVAAGTASVTVKGRAPAVFLAAGETWRAPVITADVDLPLAPSPPTPSVVAPAPPVVAPAPARHAAVPSPRVATSAPPREVSARTAPSLATTAPAITAPHAAVTAPAEAPAPTASAIATTEAPRAAPPVGPTATERHFQAGTALLRAGKAADAAIELGAAADSGSDALAVDARYFQAVALAKAGHHAQAETALVAFLDHAPTSMRRGRAAVMLARLMLDRGDRTSARAWFEAAAADADPSVSAAGRAGLASLSH
jgi:hypothetical protein